MYFDFVLRRYLVRVCRLIWCLLPHWETDGLTRSDIYLMRRAELEKMIRWYFLDYLEYSENEAMHEFRHLVQWVIDNEKR